TGVQTCALPISLPCLLQAQRENSESMVFFAGRAAQRHFATCADIVVQIPGRSRSVLSWASCHRPVRPFAYFSVRSHHSERPSSRTCARPLQTLVWYPAQGGAGKPMTVGDYVRLADTEITFNGPDKKDNRWRRC